MYSWLSQVHQATPPTRFKVNDIQAKNSKGNKAFQTPLSEPVLGEVPRSGVEKGKESGGRCSRMCSKLKRRNGSRKRKSSWNSRKGGRVWYECGTAGRLLHRGINTGRLQRPSLETKGKRERARMEGKCVCNDIGVQRGEKMVVVSRRKRDLVRVRYAPFDYRWSSSREPIENFVDL